MPLVSKSFSDIITFTRASSGTYFDATGTLQTATTNNARFDYNPSTLAAKGMLVEEQRTNSIRNNTMQGAVAGTPGTMPTNWQLDINTTTGLTKSVVGTGTENGINYVDLRVNGTATGAGSFDVVFDTSTAIAALNGQTWAPSLYWKLAAGSMTGLSTPTFWLYSYTSAPAFLSSNSISLSTPTSAGLATQRQTGAATLAGGATTAYVRPLVKFTISDGAVIDITLRIGLPQLEQGAFATSVISTTTAAATRSADVASVNTLSPWYNASAGTIFCSSIPMNVSSSNFANWAIGNSSLAFGAANTIYNLYTSSISGAAATNAIVGGAGQVAALTPTYTQSANTLAKSATAYELNNYANSVNGLAAATDTSATVPTVTGMSLGSLASGWSGATNYLNGWIQRITYYPRRLSNAELQGITT